MLVLLLHFKLQKLQPRCMRSDKCLVKMENALNVWVEDMNRKCVLIDGHVLSQKALSLYEDFGKGSPENSNTRPLTAGKVAEWTDW